MLTKRFVTWFGVGGLLLFAGAGCALDGNRVALPDEVGTIELSLTQAPMDVRCIQVSIETTAAAQRLFSATPGQPATLTVPRVPAGPVTVSEAAFDAECARVGTGTRPTWQSVGSVAATVVARQTTAVSIVLRPTGSLRVGSDFQPGPLAVDPASADFGSVPIGGMSRAITVTLRNGTGATTGRIAATLTGATAGEFSVASNDCTTLAANRTCRVGLILRPTSAGGKSAILQLSASPGGAASVALVGVGLGPASLVITPAEIDFGSVASGGSAGPITVTVRNVGQSETHGLRDVISAISDGSVAFRFASEDCVGQSLAPGAECVMNVFATPEPDLDAGTVKTATLTSTGTGGAVGRALLRLTIF